MRYDLLMVMMLMVANFALAQAPVDDALQRGQRKAGAAFSELQKAEYETKRAEQEHRQSDNDYTAVQKRADDLKQQADAAKKKLDAARAREASVRKTYDVAVDAVDRIAHPAAKK
jgi:predicted  nucleic acid-binding Zn-ribbon protein